MSSVEHVKRYTTVGTAHDQGKTSGVLASGVVAELLGVPTRPSWAPTTFRPPYTPVPFAALAGRDRGELYDPSASPPCTSGTSRTAPCSRTSASGSGRGTTRAPARTWTPPCRASAAPPAPASAIMDGSTLGKIDVQGPDAGEFLDLLYTNMMSTLKVGMVRYGVMCGVDGMVIDDGTVDAARRRTASWSPPPPATPPKSWTGWRSGCRPSGRSCGCAAPR